MQVSRDFVYATPSLRPAGSGRRGRLVSMSRRSTPLGVVRETRSVSRDHETPSLSRSESWRCHYRSHPAVSYRVPPRQARHLLPTGHPVVRYSRSPQYRPETWQSACGHRNPACNSHTRYRRSMRTVMSQYPRLGKPFGWQSTRPESTSHADHRDPSTGCHGESSRTNAAFASVSTRWQPCHIVRTPGKPSTAQIPSRSGRKSSCSQN